MNTTIILPNVKFALREHILAKDKTAMKYVNKTQLLAEINLLCEAIRKAGAPITAPQPKSPFKECLMDVYGWLYRECIKYNEAILAERQAKLQQSSIEKAVKHPTPVNARRHRLSDVEERFTRYSDELAKREAGDMMGLDAKGQKHRIASLKRKIARAEASLKKYRD